MKITIVAVGQQMPTWVNQGFADYLKRFPKQIAIELLAIPLTTRKKSTDLARQLKLEESKIVKALPVNNYYIALADQGKSWSSIELSKQLNQFYQASQNITFIIGGPEGLTEKCYQTADACWSLSPLTLPHPLVRLVLIEALYRAYTIMINHPYHK